MNLSAITHPIGVSTSSIDSICHSSYLWPPGSVRHKCSNGSCESVIHGILCDPASLHNFVYELLCMLISISKCSVGKKMLLSEPSLFFSLEMKL